MQTFFHSFFQLKTTIKSWEEKHKELNEKIKVYQKSQKELEDSVVLKDHNVEVRIVSYCHYCTWISDVIPKNASTYPMSPLTGAVRTSGGPGRL